VNTAGSGTTPAGSGDRHYIATRGNGGTPSSTASVRAGKPGLVVILI
jgi:hypothetical protein